MTITARSRRKGRVHRLAGTRGAPVEDRGILGDWVRVPLSQRGGVRTCGPSSTMPLGSQDGRVPSGAWVRGQPRRVSPLTALTRLW